jgi:hypothetical protein
MQARAGQRGAVVERLHDGVAEFLLAARQGGHAAFARRPVARGRIEQHLLEAVVLEAGGDLAGREVVGEQELDGLEAGLGGGFEAVEEGHFDEHHRQVGGEARHGRFPRACGGRG